MAETPADTSPLIDKGSTNEQRADDPLPVWRKICFAIGGAPYQITNNVIGFFLNIFLLEVAQIPPSYAAIILFGGKFWDALTDPMCGYLVNRTETRLGKLRPWILFSSPLACVTYFFLWYVPDGFSQEAKLAFYFVMFCGFEGLLSGLHVPYTSLTMYITRDQKERDSATAYRMWFEAIGVLIAAVVQGTLVGKTRCGESEELPPIHEQEDAYRLCAFIVVGIYMLCCLVVFFGTKENPGVVPHQDAAGYFHGLKSVLTFSPYIKLCMTFLFFSLAIAIVQVNLALYITHSLDMGDDFSLFLIILLCVTISLVPIWQIILKRFGKKTSIAAGMIIYIPVLISQLYLEHNEYAFIFILVAASLTVSCSLLLPWSMLPDVIDEYTLKTGERKDAIFYSFYVFFNKLAIGVGAGLSQAALALGGYVTGECKQPGTVDLALRLLVAPGPVVCILMALMFLWSYPIDENRRCKNRVALLSLTPDEGIDVHQQQKKPTKGPPNFEPIKSLSYETITDSTGF